MKYLISFFIGCFFCSEPLYADTDDKKIWSTLKPFVHARTFSYSENMPLEAFDNDFEGEFPRSGRYEFTHNLVEAGIAYRGFELSAFTRQDYYFRTIDDTFNLIYIDQNDWDWPLDQVFDVYLHVQKVEANGGKFGYRFQPDPSLELYAAAKYFESDDVLYGQLEGRIWETERRPYADLVLDYIYTEDSLLDRPLTAPASGYGHGFDLGLSWDINDRFSVDVLLEDVNARFKWKHAPHTSAVMVSDRNRIDENGNPYKLPTLAGKHDFVDRTQVLPRHNWGRLTYKFERWRLIAEQETYDRVRFNRLLAGFSPIHWFEVEAGFDFKSDAISLKFWTPYISLLLGTDEFDLKQSRNIRMELMLQYAF